MDQSQRVKEIREAIILAHPEFAPLILPMELVAQEQPGARMATDGHKIYWSPSFVEGTDDPNVATSIGHESLHNALLHCLRSRITGLIGPVPTAETTPQEQEAWLEKKKLSQLAADLVVNPILKAAGFDLRDRVYEAKYEGMSWEEIYHQLQSQGKGKGKPQHKHGECQLIITPGAEEGTEGAEKHVQQMKQAFADFLTLAKLAGTLPGSMIDKLTNVLTPEIHWLDLLQDWITTICGKEDYTWKRPSRRGLAVDLYLPSGIDQSIQCLGFGSDTSGSMSEVDCAKAVRGVVQAAATVKIQKFIWVEGDAAVQRVLEFEGQFTPPTDIKGRGGTDFRPIIKELLKHDPICIVYFTDLEGTFPEQQPLVPVIWITTNSGGTVPWGKVVRIK